MKAVLIPVKDPARAKTRLGDVLSLEERKRLAWAMFMDVAVAVAAAARPDRVVVVTNFTEAIEHARRLGFDVLVEEGQVSESRSVDWASRLLFESGFESVLRLPADAPLVEPGDVDELLSIPLRAPGAVLVPSREGTGTNALMRTPPDLFPSRFGPNSLSLHKREAARVGARCRVLANSRLALDIDEPCDLQMFLDLGTGTRAYDALAAMKIGDKLAVKAPSRSRRSAG